MWLFWLQTLDANIYDLLFYYNSPYLINQINQLKKVIQYLKLLWYNILRLIINKISKLEGQLY